MAAPAAGPNPNPLFPQAPTRVWQLYKDGQSNWRSHQRLMKWISRVIEARGMAENGGARNVLSVTSGDKAFTFDVTPTGGFFVVVMRAPEGWAEEDLPLAFSCKNLYLLGFMHQNRWHFFDDADLTGSGHDAEDLPEGAWERLPFCGGYRGDKFNSVEVGVFELWLSYDALVDYPGRSQVEVENGLFRLTVVICEAVRFPAWRKRVSHLLAGYSRAEAVNKVRLYSMLFHDWTKIGTQIKEGEAAFRPAEPSTGKDGMTKPGFAFATYQELLDSISVILNEDDTLDD